MSIASRNVAKRRQDRLGDRGGQAIARVAVDGGHDGRVLGRELEQPIELADRAIGDHPRRGHALGDALVEQVDRRGEVRRERVQPSFQPIHALRGVGALQRRDLPEQRDGAVHVVGDVEEVEPVLGAGERSATDRLEDVGRDLAVLVEVVAVDRGERVEVRPCERLVGRAPGLGGVGQPVVVAFVADEGPHQRLLREDPFPRVVGQGVELLFRMHEARSFLPSRGVQA